MTLEKFLQNCSHVPWEFDHVARVAAKVKDHELGPVAERYLKALRELEDCLDRAGWEFG